VHDSSSAQDEADLVHKRNTEVTVLQQNPTACLEQSRLERILRACTCALEACTSARWITFGSRFKVPPLVLDPSRLLSSQPSISC
jgi:hypothetical protein